MQEIAQLLIMLVAYYATFGIMAIGFAMMLGGTDSASGAGNFFFVRPVRRAFAWLRTAIAGIWSNIIRVVGRWIAAEMREIARDIRWLVTRPRGWLRRR